MDLSKLQTSIITTGDDTPLDTLIEYHDKATFAKQLAKETFDECERRILARVLAHGPFVKGNMLYTDKDPPVTKCNDTKAALEALSIHTGGDWDLLCQHLVSQPLKHGQCKKTLPPEVFEQHFTVTREPVLDVSEATPAKLRKINLQYIG